VKIVLVTDKLHLGLIRLPSWNFNFFCWNLSI